MTKNIDDYTEEEAQSILDILGNLNKYTYDTEIEKTVETLCNETGINNKYFFRMLMYYTLTNICSNLRTSFKTIDGTLVPVNMYAIMFCASGFGKGKGFSKIKNGFEDAFFDKFKTTIMPEITKKNIEDIVAKEQLHNPEMDALARTEEIHKALLDMGLYKHMLSDITVPALRQFKTALQIKGCGSFNLKIDEIASNVSGDSKALIGALLELYDTGFLSEKQLKQTKEYRDVIELNTPISANLMAFGEPSGLFDDGANEQIWNDFLTQGGSRRCFYLYIPQKIKSAKLSSLDRVKNSFKSNETNIYDNLKNKLLSLANIDNVGSVLTMSNEVLILSQGYKDACEIKSSQLLYSKVHQKTELEHRYWKAQKIAGMLAWFNGSKTIELEHLIPAIKFTEDSGHYFTSIQDRKRPPQLLAEYLSEAKNKCSYIDLIKDLPFFAKKGNGGRRDLIKLAKTWAMDNSIIIEETTIDDSVWLTGTSLKATNLDNICYTYSEEMAKGYFTVKDPTYLKWENLHTVFCDNKLNWCNHFFEEGHRLEDKAIAGFNLLVLDIDDSLTLEQAKFFLQEYKALYYKTKSYTGEHNRFRIVIPISHYLEMSASEYKNFMINVSKTLPFKTDSQTFQRSRKWQGCDIGYEYTDGKLFDVTPFLQKHKEKKTTKDKSTTLIAEEWFIKFASEGNGRNNTLLRYGLNLIDSGETDYLTVTDKVIKLNDKLSEPLTESEIENTIFKSLQGKLNGEKINEN